jgi:hypothetical protein
MIASEREEGERYIKLSKAQHTRDARRVAFDRNRQRSLKGC